MSPDSPGLRVSDTEREQVATALGQHMALGRLTMSEFESRLDAAYAARTRSELDVVSSDLPRTERVHEPAQAPETPSRACSWHPWALTGAICVLVWFATSLAQDHPVDFWPIWVIGPWGIIVLTHAVPRRRV